MRIISLHGVQVHLVAELLLVDDDVGDVEYLKHRQCLLFVMLGLLVLYLLQFYLKILELVLSLSPAL